MIDLPFEARRRLLEQLVEPGPNWTVPSLRIGGGSRVGGGDGVAGSRGRDRETPRLDLSAGDAVEGLAQDQEPDPGRVDHRRVHDRDGQPLRHVRRIAGRPGDRTTACGSPAASAPASTSARSSRCARDWTPSSSTTVPSIRRRPALSRERRPGSSRSCARPSRSPSSPTTASSATPASSTSSPPPGDERVGGHDRT